MEEKVQNYVYQNYKHLKDKNLIIEEFESHFAIKLHKEDSPLILGKGII